MLLASRCLLEMALITEAFKKNNLDFSQVLFNFYCIIKVNCRENTFLNEAVMLDVGDLMGYFHSFL